MNFIEVIGGSKDRRDVAKETTNWFLKNYLPRFRTLDITINLIGCYKSENRLYGQCVVIDNAHREFEIDIDKNLRLFDFVSTLCHELIHLKQYARFEMKDVDANKIRWKASIFKDTIMYDDAPWEKEAYKLDVKLAKKCFEDVL